MKKYIKTILLILISFLIPIFIEKFIYPFESFSIIRAIIIFLIIIFVFSFFIFDRKKELEFLWKKRYLLGISLFIILVLFGFHGSSISIYSQVIQPNHSQENANPILGVSRTIRGDEWAVSTPTLLSQTKNNFNEFSTILNAKTSNISLYPKIVSFTLGAIATPNQLGFLFLPTNQAFSFSWYFGYFLLFFSSLELLMLITKKNKFYSVMGAILITFSTSVQWWEAWNIIAYGELAIILFDKYLKQDKNILRILLASLIGIIGSCYIMCLYPAWQITYGFLFLILAIWVGKENKENISIKKIALLVLIVVAIICVIVGPIFLNSYDIYLLISNTSYPGERLSTGGNGWQNLFNYFSSIFNSFKESSNASEMSQFMSLYPIPIIMGIYYWHNNRKKYKKDFLLVSLTLLSILLTVWNYVELPVWLAKVSLMFMSTPTRSAITASFVCLILLIYCLSKYSENKILSEVKYQNLIISLLVCFIGIYAISSHYPDYINNKMIIIDLLIFVPVMFGFLLNFEKTNKICLMIVTAITFVSGITVHPLNIGLDSIYEKPISKELENIEKEDPDADWVFVGSQYYMSNYLVANGADTINSTNYYPNFELWEKLGLEEYEDIYNRYAHLLVDITENETSLKLNYEDQIQLNLNNEDICKLDLDYLLTMDDNTERFNSNVVNFDQIYNEDGMLIYSINCK